MNGQTEITDVNIPSKFNLAYFLYKKSLSMQVENKPAFICENSIVTYQELYAKVKKCAGFFNQFKLNYGDRIVILLPDCLEFIVAFLATIWHGNISVLINETASNDDIIYMINDSQAKIIISTSNWQEKLHRHSLNYIEKWVLIDDNKSFLTVINKYDNQLPKETMSNESAFWVYTSGSTGHPKGVMHAHKNAIIATENYGIKTLRLKKNDVIYSAPPMAFSYGLGTTLYMPLYLGATAIVAAASHVFGQVEIINQHKPSVFFGIPNHFANIIALKDILPLDPGNLRLCISAGEKLPHIIWHKWNDYFGIKICEGIGTTESTHIFISNEPGFCVPGSTGKVVPGYKIELVDDEGKLVPENTIGILQVIGEGMMLGYWNKPCETKKTLVGNRLKLNDYYTVNKEGDFYFCGRNDDLIKVNGIWVLPVEIEDIILRHDVVLEAAVTIGFNEKTESSEIATFIVLKKQFTNSIELSNSIKEFLKHNLPKYKLPKQYHFIEKLPRTTTGKIYRQALAKIIMENRDNEYIKK